ncbi:SGNH/GDSL hydrolase family protein [Desmospora activa]|uniref:Lysophospholipase L1-like esterase n=1 Tax=Desmospora activa DSM 45169 TaxID=1121389 RepID=A0A2T4ZDF0_9BACL|nr:GDSL-type esterase/lipase family protein [Desmospora activa]PTM59892.1 lysophospholipase L1-like esterase [Desmospora activa DSM 45169]
MNPITYLALGDSLTEGIGASGPDRHLVAQYFTHMRNSDQCRVINMGISGLTSAELCHLVQSPALEKLIPRVSHITVTTGGCDFIAWYEGEGVNLPGLARTMKRVVKQVEQLLSHLRRLNPEATIEILGFYMPVPAYKHSVAIASRAVRTLNRAYRYLSKRYGAVLIDPFELFFNRIDYFADEVHPNQQGYDALVQLFLQTQESKVASPTTDDPIYT